MRAVAGILALLASTTAEAQGVRPSLSDTFRLGTNADVLCRMQARTRDVATSGMFDRAWNIVCRDAAKAIGTVRALRGERAEDRLVELRTRIAACQPAQSVKLEDGQPALRAQCRALDNPVGYSVYSLRRGNTTYVAEGLSGYDSALELALRTVVADRIVAGKVTVATSAVDDPVAFARVQAGALDPYRAVAEGYRRNNSGDYAQAAEFFDVLQQQSNRVDDGEYLINRALQKSNLGEFGEADALFAQAERLPTRDKVQLRLRRNFRALHLLNQRRFAEAFTALETAVPPATEPRATVASAVEIGEELAAQLNSGSPAAQRLGATDFSALSPSERSQLLDAQARQIKGSLYRLTGRLPQAQSELEAAGREVAAVRGGRVVSVTRARAQILFELGLTLEQQGDPTGGEARFREGVALLAARYPETAALTSARARLAAFLLRHGKTAEGKALFREVVALSTKGDTTPAGLGNLLSPYLAQLAGEIGADPALADDFFLATQALVRPGVADTQAVLARELSEGVGEGSRLFRQARSLERDVERTRVELASLQAEAGDAAEIAVKQRALATLADQQVATQAELAKFPQYRAIATKGLTLPELKATLKGDEAYLKLLVAGGRVYGMGITSGRATAWQVPLTPGQLDAAVDQLRATIVVDEAGQLNTYPFDVDASHKLFAALAGPFAAELTAARHVVFEPDGAMLRLPANLLVTDRASVERYAARIANPDADQFDFGGVAWLGRTASVSTAVSARAFREARTIPASAASKTYLGFGENAPAVVRPAAVTGGVAGCDWPAAEWSKPISARELRQVAGVVGGVNATVTGAAFTDLAVMQRPDLADYRILHFATHGLVTAPRAGCPARPALLTSFATSGGSDGLLSFREIYDLRIDADLVLLSACDTAGKATVAATREAGVTSGGGNALDGLVRAFIGAGGRSIVASHWPAPEDFSATERLMTGLFETKDASVGEALRRAQVALMNDVKTSHPYYWAGFAIVGDGARPLIRAR